ncbi:hypothetical protein IT072_18085 [Leifsonia sp. ZF2019]|uniref:helix-turn-helix transcriptional regulator n=1 Tax=Leifsonia sp. ZF2019 TaxID=2781978 RepID=UPI001CBB9B81|nr:LuxR C-terminal-related transcriptional regulator [Leifsonia sp. ZF2019]UAJ79093.1 hypothetical protein IT072_18085 [Leifsonia sp. ZF2019]
MIFHFAETARVVAAHVAEGRSVRLVGSAGSGRSTTVRQIGRLLEERGFEVLRTPETARPLQLPGFAVASMQLGAKEERRTPVDAALAMQRTLLETPGAVLLIDDADLIDAVSMEVLDSVSPPLVSVRVLRVSAGRSEPVWPEVTVAMPELGFEGVAELLRDRLPGADPSTAVTARILSTSGGNPELVVAIAESALQSGLLRQEAGLWRMAERSLWNEQLIPLLRWRIRDLSPEAVRALRHVALNGPVPFGGGAFDGDDETVGLLLAAGFVRIVDVVPSERFLDVWPPLIGDLFAQDPVRVLIGDDADGFPRSRRPPTASVVTGAFHVAADTEADERFRQWQRTPTTAVASAYVFHAPGTLVDGDRVDEVFARTSHAAATRDELFRFTFERAAWLAFDRGDLDAGLTVLAQLVASNRLERARARSAALLLQAFLEAVPAGFAAELEELGSEDTSGFARQVLATLFLFSGEVGRAKAELAPVLAKTRGIAPTSLASLVNAYAGDLRGAYTDALAQRDAAAQERDRTEFVSASYIAVLTATLEGRIPDASELIRSTLGLAPVTMFARPMFGGILNIASAMARVDRPGSAASRILARDVSTYASFAGPVYATGNDLTPPETMRADERRGFERLLAGGVRLRRSRGYLLSAWTTAVSAATFDTGDEIVDQLEELAAAATPPLFVNSARAASAVRAHRVGELRAMVDGGAVGQDVQLVAQILRAGQRRADAEGHREVAAELEPLCRGLEARAASPLHPLTATLDADEPLSAREREVALLAGGMTNAQIALRLSISVRTVEHHISNGLRKTGRQTRAELAAAASEGD